MSATSACEGSTWFDLDTLARRFLPVTSAADYERPDASLAIEATLAPGFSVTERGWTTRFEPFGAAEEPSGLLADGFDKYVRARVAALLDAFSRKVESDIAEILDEGGAAPSAECQAAARSLAARMSPALALTEDVRWATFVEEDAAIGQVLHSMARNRRASIKVYPDGVTLQIIRTSEHLAQLRTLSHVDDWGGICAAIDWLLAPSQTGMKT